MSVVNEQLGQFSRFPAGESHIRLDADVLSVDYLYVQPQNHKELNNWIIETLLAAEAIKAMWGFIPSICMPYLPYSRQDRRMAEGEPFSLKVILDLFKSQGVKKLITLDVHSDAANLLFDGLVSIPVEDILLHHISLFNNISHTQKTLIVPDQGAYKRLKKAHNMFADVAVAVKDRNVNTGHLTIKGLVGDVEGKDCLIVDDICDGGATFVLLAEELKNRGAKSIELYVTHGIFSKGFDALEEAGISKIYTTNSVNYFRGGTMRINPESELKIEVADTEEIINRFLESELD